MCKAVRLRDVAGFGFLGVRVAIVDRVAVRRTIGEVECVAGG